MSTSSSANLSRMPTNLKHKLWFYVGHDLRQKLGHIATGATLWTLHRMNWTVNENMFAHVDVKLKTLKIADASILAKLIYILSYLCTKKLFKEFVGYPARQNPRVILDCIWITISSRKMIIMPTLKAQYLPGWLLLYILAIPY